jgi:hypothetical protein
MKRSFYRHTLVGSYHKYKLCITRILGLKAALTFTRWAFHRANESCKLLVIMKKRDLYKHK